MEFSQELGDGSYRLPQPLRILFGDDDRDVKYLTPPNHLPDVFGNGCHPVDERHEALLSIHDDHYDVGLCRELG
ncbi:MAG: hypothetical protein M1298_01310 [Chloroflexi bacterium]|nr:hypothetical protein [Chloroflexota bacterium]